MCSNPSIRIDPLHATVDLSGPYYFSQCEIHVKSWSSTLLVFLAKWTTTLDLFFSLSGLLIFQGWDHLFMICNHSFTRTSPFCEIDWDCRYSFDLISTVECFWPLTFSQFRKAPSIEHVCSMKLFQAVGWALLWSHPFIYLLALTDSTKAKIWPHSHILGQNHDRSLIFFIFWRF